MVDKDPIEVAREGVSIVAEVIKAAGQNPHVSEAANNLGRTAVTLTKAINNVLVPLAAINFAIDKAREYFSGRFQKDISDKAESIPPDCIVEPKASIAGPALQGLAFTHEEPNLKEMYLNLLTTSMDGRSSSLAHPAFVEVIRQLDSDDARLVRDALVSLRPLPIVQIRREKNNGATFEVILSHLINLKGGDTGMPVEDSRIPAMVDNWIRLGLVEVDYDKHLADESFYAWVEHRPEFVKLNQEQQPPNSRITYQKGFIRSTAFGKQFSRAVGLV